ncbi:Cof-type HAD-IIB family hydrolase [Peribacillus sp. SCS-155]|uniref:Cof-type HAD-IIB family hydrolase n=1 Tax=Peribacillus sedimenti TaxID=3115297 RepID=UPI003905D9D9
MKLGLGCEVVKIVFFDIDGTLLDHDKKLPSSTKKAIEQLQNNGIYVAISTGRAPFMFTELRKELGIETFVSFNGQYVVFENEVIYKHPLALDEVRALHKAANENESTPLIFLNEKTMKSSVKHSERIVEAMGSLKFTHPEQDEHFYEDHQIYQALLFTTGEEQKWYENKYDSFRFIRWHKYSVDVLPKGGSKAGGIKTLMEKVGFKLEDVYAFGDGLNDIEMLETVGHGIAMGNALDEVKGFADYVTTGVDQDGIYNGLRYYKLI